MVWESSQVLRFDLGPLSQGQMRVAKRAYNSFIVSWDAKPAYWKSWAGNLLCGQIWPWAPPSRSNNGSLVLVSCLSGGYNLHQFSDALGLVYYPTALKGCQGIVFNHGIQMAVRCRELILGREIS